MTPRERAQRAQRARGNAPEQTKKSEEVQRDFTPWLYHTGAEHKEWLASRRGE